MVLGNYEAVLVGTCGAGSVWGSTGWYIIVLGHYGTVLVGTWLCLVSVG